MFLLITIENKLKKLKKSDTNKVTGKDLLSSMNEFKEIYMSNYFHNTDLNNEQCSNEMFLDNVDKSYLEVLDPLLLNKIDLSFYVP